MDDALEIVPINLARETLYRYFAALLADPRTVDARVIFAERNVRLALSAAELLREPAASSAAPLGFGEVSPEQLTLVPVAERLAHLPGKFDEEFDRVFGLVTFRECPPYETEYCASEDPFFRAQQMADVGGFYRAFGLAVGRARPDRPDHVALELEFMAHLLMLQRLATNDRQAATCREALRTFFRDHLVWWVPSFTLGLRRRDANGVFGSLAAALAAFIAAERIRFELPPLPAPVRPRGIALPVEEPENCADCAVLA
jgi:TorA maturation chaperone TorD